MLVAQTNRGGITGTVFDKSGAVVTGAAVTITNKGTNQQFKVKTSPAGAYNLPSLDPVMYSVSVEAEGFKKSVVENVKVDTAVVSTVDVTLGSTMLTGGREGRTVPLELVEWSIGPVRLVSVPGEAFHALGRAIEDRVAGGQPRLPGSDPGKAHHSLLCVRGMVRCPGPH
jgi:hypothetical protein